ncbi:hypothetical protein D6853_10240 [Butyrivibrio sp. X503]|nr:hypothetical protein D6853_10240 [Butyrivibrio sp. X503]
MTGNSFIMNNPIFNQKKMGLQQSASQLIFNKSPFDMEGEVCGTESMLYAAQCWHEIADSSDKLQVFLADDIYKMCSNIQNSINQTDQILAASLSCSMSNYTQVNVLPAVKAIIAKGISDAISVTTVASAKLMKRMIYMQIREEFMTTYNIDEETMAQVDEWIEQYEAGDPAFVTVLKKYQNMSDKEWKQLYTDESKEQECKDFVALTVLFTWSGYMAEQGKDGTGTYQGVCENIISNFYTVKEKNEDDLFSDATIDNPLVNNFRLGMDSLGASDSLAYNISTKLLSDQNAYHVNNQSDINKDVDVNLYYDESGFVGVQVRDCKSANPENINQFLATGKEHAKEYISSQREGISNYSNHLMSDDELAGMFQSVNTPNDLNIMRNLVISDSKFMIDGDNAFDIEYMEDHGGQGYYKEGISDTFSVALGQMSSTILERGAQSDYVDYENFLEAVSDSSIKGSNHNILFDITTGTGTYVDNCAINVVDDEIGGDNDQELKAALNAANANFGALSQLYERYIDDANLLQGDATYSNVDVKDISYSEQDGHLTFWMNCDKESGFAFWRDKEKQEFKIDVNLSSDGLAFKDQQEAIQQDLKNEMERKKANLVVDTVIDLTGNINPFLKDSLYIVKDISTQKDVSIHAATLVKDGMGKVFKGEKYKHLNGGVSAGTTLMGAYSKYNDIIQEYEKAKEQCNEVEKLNSFYCFNTGSHTVGLYDYDSIRRVQRWNENGVVEIVGGDEKTNDKIYNSLVTDGEINNSVLKTIGVDLCDEEHAFDHLDDDSKARPTDAYDKIEQDTGYTKDNIEEALNLMIHGYNNDEDATYRSITDIPFELQDACMHTISVHGPDSNIYEAW